MPRARSDVGLCPGVIVEIKGGHAARIGSDGLIDTWIVETETERVNAGADVAFLVTQRAGVGATNAHRWWAWWRLGWLPDLAVVPPHDQLVIRMRLGDALQLLRAAGYGQPLDARRTFPAAFACRRWRDHDEVSFRRCPAQTHQRRRVRR